MSNEAAFTHADPELLPILRELEPREPIFHRPEFGKDVSAFARLMAAEYWEIGASGRRYSREFILEHLEANPPVDSDTAGWITQGFACRSLGPDTYLVTYTLDQNGRWTRRSTIWRRANAEWQILFHQGTVIQQETTVGPASGEDDTAPAEG